LNAIKKAAIQCKTLAIVYLDFLDPDMNDSLV
jgi:hypothetical protein